MANNEEIKKLLEENQNILQEIYKSTEKTRKYILWGRIMTLIYLILILVPIILAIIYIPPLIKNAIEPYKELLETGKEQGQIFNELQEFKRIYR